VSTAATFLRPGLFDPRAAMSGAVAFN